MARRDDHPEYWECTDEDCSRFPCRVFKEGVRLGYDGGATFTPDGWHAGYRQGYPDGYSDGFAAGTESAGG